MTDAIPMRRPTEAPADDADLSPGEPACGSMGAAVELVADVVGIFGGVMCFVPENGTNRQIAIQ